MVEQPSPPRLARWFGRRFVGEAFDHPRAAVVGPRWGQRSERLDRAHPSGEAGGGDRGSEGDCLAGRRPHVVGWERRIQVARQRDTRPDRRRAGTGRQRARPPRCARHRRSATSRRGADRGRRGAARRPRGWGGAGTNRRGPPRPRATPSARIASQPQPASVTRRVIVGSDSMTRARATGAGSHASTARPARADRPARRTDRTWSQRTASSQRRAPLSTDVVAVTPSSSPASRWTSAGGRPVTSHETRIASGGNQASRAGTPSGPPRRAVRRTSASTSASSPGPEIVSSPAAARRPGMSKARRTPRTAAVPISIPMPSPRRPNRHRPGVAIITGTSSPSLTRKPRPASKRGRRVPSWTRSRSPSSVVGRSSTPVRLCCSGLVQWETLRRPSGRAGDHEGDEVVVEGGETLEARTAEAVGVVDQHDTRRAGAGEDLVDPAGDLRRRRRPAIDRQHAIERATAG